MRNRKYGAIIVLLIILMGVIIFSMRPKSLEKTDSLIGGQTNNPPFSAAVKDRYSKQAEATTNSAPVYLTQDQQDSRQHKWGKSNLPEVEDARRDGAEAKVTLRVIDSHGTPVPEADIQMAFFPKDSYEAAIISKGLTDKDGLFVVSGKTIDDISFSASKTNYYVTSRKFHFYWRGTECAKDGRWIPWNPTLEVVLKEKRKPIPMLTKKTKIFLPEKGKQFGFDCLVGDLVAPYGKGVSTDLMFSYTSEMSGWSEYRYTNELVVSTGGQLSGVIKKIPDVWSQLIAQHEAPELGYQPNFVLDTIAAGPQNIKGKMDYEDEFYLFFRSRVVTNKLGSIVSANYGKIYPEFHFGEAPPEKGQGRVSFSYYFNPNPNDRNLEFDGKNNLFNPDRKDNWPRNP